MGAIAFTHPWWLAAVEPLLGSQAGMSRPRDESWMKNESAKLFYRCRHVEECRETTTCHVSKIVKN